MAVALLGVNRAPGVLMVVLSMTLFSPPLLAGWNENGTVVCSAPRNQSWPFVASRGNGAGLIAWSDQRDSSILGWDVYAQCFDQSGVAVWESDGAPVCVSPGDQIGVQLLPMDDGGAIAVWNDFRSGALPALVWVKAARPAA